MSRHHVKASEAADQCLAVARETQQAPLPAGYIKVAKPHISLVKRVNRVAMPVSRRMWRIQGVTGATLYGGSPALAYQAWRRHIEGNTSHNRRPTS